MHVLRSAIHAIAGRRAVLLIAVLLPSWACAQTATHVLTPQGWTPKEQATELQVLRNSVSSFVPMADVTPTDRVKACATFSGTTCTSRAPGRTDSWWLLSDVFPPPPVPTKTSTVRWSAPQNPDGSEYTDVLGYKLTIRRQNCDPALPLCPVATETEQVIKGPEARSYAIEGVVFQVCVTNQAFNDSGDGAVEREVCGPRKSPPPAVTNLTVE